VSFSKLSLFYLTSGLGINPETPPYVTPTHLPDTGPKFPCG
jgi:hypothetical protein